MAWGKRFFRRAALGRFCAVLLGLALLCAAIISLWLTPLQQQRFTLTDDNRQKRRYVAQLKQKGQRSEKELPSNMPAKPMAFSVGDLIEQAAGRLVALRQEGRRTRLTLSLAWQSLPCLFTRLEAYQDIRLLAFRLEGENDRVQVSLSMEIMGENI